MEVEYGKAGTPDQRLYPTAKPESKTGTAKKKPAAKKKAAGKKKG